MSETSAAEDTQELIEDMLDDESDAETVEAATSDSTDETETVEESSSDSASETDDTIISIEDDFIEAENSNVLLLSDNLHISELDDLYQVLSSHMDTHKEIVLDASQVKKVDGVSLQVLIAFYQSAPANEVMVNWADCSDEFKQAAESLGLSDALGLAA